MIKFVKRKNDTAEIWLILRFFDGRVFTLAGLLNAIKIERNIYSIPFCVYIYKEHPPFIMKSNVNSNKFEAAGLAIEPLVAYKSWRITFTGHLREGIGDDLDLDSRELKFIKFNFM